MVTFETAPFADSMQMDRIPFWEKESILAAISCRDSPKGSRSSLGTRREIAGRRPEDLPQECRRQSDWRELSSID
ncbi:hypothetical protein GW17_00033835 [Ensete ventricosum]|nr:hypothetical protein GW17_00033835 [Ensete ventricosum]